MAAEGNDKTRHMLKETGLYCTRARMAVLGVLQAASSPLRQDQIAEQLADESFDKVTLYRTLESLTQVGLVHRAFVQKRACHFELADHCSEKQCHPHFTCVNCGVTHCLMNLNVPLAKVSHEGYVISRQQVRLEGLCPACA
jgi:Fur family ferric uptake transcriptional regulator